MRVNKEVSNLWVVYNIYYYYLIQNKEIVVIHSLRREFLHANR